MEYVIVYSEEPSGLELQVTSMLAKGWTPQGGVSVGAFYKSWMNERKGYEESSDEYLYAQAMVRGESSRKIIGWRTPDYLFETSDPEIARNWAPNTGCLPIFDGDQLTKLGKSGE